MRRWAFGFDGEELGLEFGGRLGVVVAFVPVYGTEAGTVEGPGDSRFAGKGGRGGTGGISSRPLPAGVELGRLGILG